MYKTAETVSPGHPDKIADLISDYVLTEALSNNKKSRVAVETFLTGTSYGGLVVVCLLYTSPSPRDRQKSRMPSSA